MATSAAPASPPTSRKMEIDIAPSPEASEAVTLRQQAGSLVVVDKASHHNALEFIRAAKQLKRKIEDHWSRITRSVDDLKRNLLDLKRQDLEPVEYAISQADTVALEYQNAEDRRVREENDRLRREAEAKAQADRERELAEQEAAALKAEKNSPILSAREDAFKVLIVAGYSPTKAALSAGFKDAEKTGARLMATPKIQDAIHAVKTAQAIRQQAEATRQQPLDVVTQTVERQTSKVAGTRTVTTYTCEVVSEAQLIAAVLAGKVPTSAVIPNGPKLNEAARSLKEFFERAYPGCRLVVKQTIAG